MKHGLKLRKLQRTSSHRAALLRNLVSALLHHEMIKTTVPKAKEAARVAEQIITLGKKGTDPARRAAQAFLMPSHHYAEPASPGSSSVAPPQPLDYPSGSSSSAPPDDPEAFAPPTSLIPKLFGSLAERYAARPGGYTRIHRYGRRPGDNAPHAIVSLVDGPRDVKYEMAIRAAGVEAVARGMEGLRVGVGKLKGVLSGGDGEAAAEAEAQRQRMRARTQRAMEKVLQYRAPGARAEFERRAAEYTDSLFAERTVIGHRRPVPVEGMIKYKVPTGGFVAGRPHLGHNRRAGERLPGMSVAHTGLGLARGQLSRRHARRDQTPRFLGEAGVADHAGAAEASA